MSQMTPMLRQYVEIKEAYPDAILFFRMGDFYEMFFDDAKNASRILGITLTSRGSYNGRKVPMCGIPHHSSRSYIAKLIENGQKVTVNILNLNTGEAYTGRLAITGNRQIYLPTEIQAMLKDSRRIRIQILGG